METMNESAKARAPQCVGIIMDGNRRWAKENGVPLVHGHQQGFEKLKEVLEWLEVRGTHHLVQMPLQHADLDARLHIPEPRGPVG